MTKQLETELKVGVFVTVGIALLLVSLLILGGSTSIFTRQNSYVTHYKSVEGLFSGAKVVLAGLPVGAVSDISYATDRQDIQVTVSVNRKYAGLVRKDTEAELVTQGVLGDKYINLSAGSPSQPELSSGDEIQNRPTKNLAEVLSRGDALMNNLNSISTSLDHILKSFDSENHSGQLFHNLSEASRNFKEATEKLNNGMGEMHLKKTTAQLESILEKVNNGTGTLGALVNDPSLYDDVKSFVGGAQRNRLLRNLVRKTIKEGEEGTPAEAPAKK